MPRVERERFDEDETGAARTGARGRRARKSAGRMAARALVKRLSWADDPLVYWTGTPAPSLDGGASGALQRRLATLPPGPYAVRLGPVAAADAQPVPTSAEALVHRSAPGVASPVPVNASLIARSLRRLLDARRLPAALPPLVGGDAAAWRTRCEAAVARARATLDAVAGGALAPPPAGCLVIGVASPPAAALARVKQKSRGRLVPPPKQAGHPGTAEPHPGLLPSWPRDVLAAAEQRVGTAELRRLTRAVPAAGDADVVAAVRDRLLLSPETLPAFLQALPDVMHLHERLADAPRRRLRAAASIQFDALAAAVAETGVTGDPLRAPGRTGPERSYALQRFRLAYDGHLAAGVERYFRKVLPRGTGMTADNPAYPAPATPPPPSPSDPVKFFRHILTAPQLREALLSAAPLAADVRRGTVRWGRHGRVPHLVTSVDPAEPLTFEKLPAVGSRVIWKLYQREQYDAPSRGSLLRLAALDAIAVTGNSAWVEACCHAWPLGERGDGHAEAVVQSLHVVRTLLPPEHRAAALATLDRCAGAVLREAMGPRPARDVLAPLRVDKCALSVTVSEVCRAVAAGIDAEAIADLMEHGQWAALATMVRTRQEHAPRFAAFLRETRDRVAHEMLAGRPRADRLAAWQLTGRASADWARIYLAVGADLLRRLIELLKPAPVPGRECKGLLDDLAEFILGPQRVGPDMTMPAAAEVAGRRATIDGALPALRGALRRMPREGADAEAHVIAALSLFGRCVLVAHAAGEPGAPAPAAPAADGDATRGRARSMFAAVMRHHARAAGTGPVADPPEFFAWREGAQLSTLVGLARGHVDRLLAIGTAPDSSSVTELAQAADGWHYLGRLQPLDEFVSRAASRPGQAGRAIRLLARIGLCLRLHRGAQLRAALSTLADAEAAKGGSRPSATTAATSADAGAPISAEHASAIAALRRWRADGTLPERVEEILRRPDSLRRELAALDTRPSLPEPARRRAAHLRRVLADPEGLARWAARDLDKYLPAALDDARLTRLEQLAHAAVASHFAEIFASPVPAGRDAAEQRNWDNALRLYFSVNANRGLLRRLLEGAAHGDHSWILARSENARFLADVRAAGVDTDAWLAPMTTPVESPGGPCRVDVETDPLHVLQMGNYFGTCLSEGDVNAFSTVANAVEVNKRVIYVYDARGTVVGRKLIALTRQGYLVGFNTYGELPPRAVRGGTDGHNPRGGIPTLKTLLDSFCRTFADRCNARLHPFPKPAPGETNHTPSPLALFAAWYDDGPEPFDPASLAPRTSPRKRRRSKPA